MTFFSNLMPFLHNLVPRTKTFQITKLKITGFFKVRWNCMLNVICWRIQCIIHNAWAKLERDCQRVKHPFYRLMLVLKLYRDCTQKQQDPLRTNVFRLQAIMSYYHLSGRERVSFAVFVQSMSNSGARREARASCCASCDAAGEL